MTGRGLGIAAALGSHMTAMKMGERREATRGAATGGAGLC